MHTSHPHSAHSNAHQAQHSEHAEHAGHNPQMFRQRFWLSLFLTLPIVFWSSHIQSLLGYSSPEFSGSQWISPLLATLVFLYGGGVFLQGAAREIVNKLPGMMSLIALAISVAFLFSWLVQFNLLAAEPLWWEVASLVTIMLLGHWIEMRSINQAQGALQELAKLLPDTATRISGSAEEKVALNELRKGDILLVRPGESIAADAIICKGSSFINESMISGESRPLHKKPGDHVIAGTINGEASLHIEVTDIGDQTKLSGIMRLVADAQHSKSRAQLLADRAARALTAVAISAGIITLIGWQFVGANLEFSIIRVVTVLVIACPHALGLAIPVVIAISTTLGAKNGLLIRDRRGLEQARNINIVVFDKTGTLTLGEFRVVEMATTAELNHDQALAIAAAIEAESEHPIAQGIVKTAQDRAIKLSQLQHFHALPGQGVSATLDNIEYKIGGPSLLKDLEIELADNLHQCAQTAADRGQAAIYLFRGNQVLAVFAVSDAIRPQSHAAIQALHQQGIEVVMLSGDAKSVADTVGKQLGIDRVFAEVLPAHKAAKIRELQQHGKIVAMVGDGINDAPALASADIGIAIGAGTDVAVESGHIVLVRSDPRDVLRIIQLSKASYRKMLQNLWWAAGYNIAAIPLAAGALAAWGIILSPAVGAVLMSASTVIVVLNAQLLRQIKL